MKLECNKHNICHFLFGSSSNVDWMARSYKQSSGSINHINEQSNTALSQPCLSSSYTESVDSNVVALTCSQTPSHSSQMVMFSELVRLFLVQMWCCCLISVWMQILGHLASPNKLCITNEVCLCRIQFIIKCIKLWLRCWRCFGVQVFCIQHLDLVILNLLTFILEASYWIFFVIKVLISNFAKDILVKLQNTQKTKR